MGPEYAEGAGGVTFRGCFRERFQRKPDVTEFPRFSYRDQNLVSLESNLVLSTSQLEPLELKE